MKRNYLILLLLAPCISNAEDGYWVCVGSFRDPDVAAQHRLASAHEFPDQLRVIEADTSMGRFFRVVVGPYETALRGNEVLEDVQRTRPDAWLLVTSVSSAYNTDYIDNRASTDGLYGGYRFSDPDDSSADWEYRVPAVQDNGAGIEVTSTAKIVEVAPPGYNVHRLNPPAARTDD
jgi:hypothetical protein